MKLAIALLTVPLLSTSLCVQDPAQKDPDFKVPTVTRLTETERLFRAYGVTHGGRQELKALKTVSFRMVPADVTEEGEVEDVPSRIDVQLEGVDRRMRLDEEIDGQHILKIANGMEEASVWINNESRDVPAKLREAQTESKVFYMLLDLLYKPESPDLKSKFTGEKKRDTRLHYTMEYEFHPSRGLEHVYRVFYDKNDGLIRRIDVHDMGTRGNIRINTMLLSEYAPTAAAVEAGKLMVDAAVESAQKVLDEAATPEAKARAERSLQSAKVPPRTPQFPGRIELLERDNSVRKIWRMVDVVVNAEFEPGHFSEP